MPEEIWREGTHAITRREALKIMTLGGTGVLLAACGGAPGTRGTAPQPTASGATTDYSSRFAAFRAADEPNADPAKVDWPDFVTSADPEVRQLYEFQLQNGELMRYMPCFCGCGGDGHKSNRDCYVQSVNSDGTAVLDSMAPT
ncbi:MAG: PCYCGC domain-containing protein [Chloroflexota bacterium]|nr:PCYCGC domain-containing protein [Chloroflexota bacterium]